MKAKNGNGHKRTRREMMAAYPLQEAPNLGSLAKRAARVFKDFERRIARLERGAR
jgi:hypothetical protein